MTKHREQGDILKAHIISAISFLLGFSASFISYVISLYFKEVTGSDNVGPFYFIAFVLELVVIVNLHELIRRLGKSLIMHLLFLAEIATLVFLIFLPPGHLGAALIVATVLFASLLWVVLDIILETFSEDNMSGRIRGLHLTITNFGFLVGPFAATWTLAHYGFAGVFFAKLVLTILAFAIALVSLSKVNHSYSRNLEVMQIFERVRRRKNILRIYHISFVLEFFYAIMVVFTTLYLSEHGFNLGELGIVFTIMLVPFVLLQLPIGYLADKKWGEKELLITALIITTVTVLGVYFTESRTVMMWGLLLFATRVGAAMLEILRDSYFYKRIDMDDVDIIDFFRTAQPVGYIAAATISTSILTLGLSIRSLFLIAALVVFSGLWSAFKLSDNKSTQELADRT